MGHVVSVSVPSGSSVPPDSGVRFATGSSVSPVAEFPTVSRIGVASGPVGTVYVTVTSSWHDTAKGSVSVTTAPLIVTAPAGSTTRIPLTLTVNCPASGTESGLSVSSYVSVSSAPFTSARTSTGQWCRVCRWSLSR